MINVAIVEDEQEATDLLLSYFNQFSKKNPEKFNVTCFSKSISFLTNYTGNYDLVFMDIELPDMNGMTAAQKLRAIDTTVTLIFVTNMAQFAVKGYEVDAFDFIVKPVNYSSFNLKLRRALEHWRSKQDAKVMVATSDGLILVLASELKYIEITNHKMVYHTTNGDIVSYGQLKKIEPPLLKNNFIRCNRCYLVNLRHVSSVKGFSVKIGDDELQVSNLKRKEFLKALADYLGGGL